MALVDMFATEKSATDHSIMRSEEYTWGGTTIPSKRAIGNYVIKESRQNQRLDLPPGPEPSQKIRTFRNPANNYTWRISPYAGIWALLFGPLYFVTHGAWPAAIIYIVVCFASAVTVIGPFIVWIVGAFIASDIVATAYLRKGWIEETSDNESS